jgi:formate dehydrogenase subunit gamma
LEERSIVRYTKSSRVFHWLHALAFVLLSLTGLVRFLDHNPSQALAHIGMLHRAAAVLFIALPLLYYFIWPKRVTEFVKSTFKGSNSDWQWLKAAPAYYFGGTEEKMPPQGQINPGQRSWEVTIVLTGIVFIITGILLWFFKFLLPIDIYEWALTVHGIAFIVVFVFFLLHIYLGVFHPRFKQSFCSMLDGRISPQYARQHYLKWFQIINSKNEGNKPNTK